MRNTLFWTFVASLSLGVSLGACKGGAAADLQIEKLPEITPNLPAVPNLPPPPHPITYPDSSYSVYGARKRVNDTIGNEIEITAYVVDIYRAPECEKGKKGKECPLGKAPHAYLADTPNEEDPKKRVMLTNYAENQEAFDEAVAQHQKGKYEPPPVETGLPAIPVDLALGNKVKVKGRFNRVSGNGFSNSRGLLDYVSHVTVSAAEG